MEFGRARQSRLSSCREFTIDEIASDKFGYGLCIAVQDWMALSSKFSGLFMQLTSFGSGTING